MATVTVGVVGPGDLIELVLALKGRPAEVSLVPFIYEHEDQASRLVTAEQERVDGLLFTGVVPYAQARAAGVLRRPAEYVSYSGATLLRALVEQLRLGHDAAALSIDTLPRAQVIETMTEARLPTDRVRVLEYRAGITSEEVVEFHRAASREAGTKLAITCLGSAFRVLEQETHAVRLAPSRHSIREALNHLVLTVANLRTLDAQVAIGLIDLGGATDDELQRSTSPLGGALARVDDVYLVVSTAGLLDQATSHYQELPLLGQLSSRHEQVHIGFGVGRTAAEAHSLARRALGRSRAVGPAAVAVGLSDDTDIIVNGGQPSDAEPLPDDLSLLARRAGLNPTTLRQLRELSADRPANQDLLTASDVAEYLGVQERTARRVVKRLERSGIAEVVSAQRDGHSGRPRLLYRIRL